MDKDIVIAGGGIAGLTAAAAFGKAGFSVLVVEPSQPVTSRDAKGADLRSTAFLQPSRAFLERAGIWPQLAPHAMPLEIMRIVDADGQPPAVRVSRDFDSLDVSDMPFGWNLPNWLLRRELLTRLEDLPSVTLRSGERVTGLFTRTHMARVQLSGGDAVRTRLAIACDGRNSTLRAAAGIDVHTTRFGQKALAFAVTHPLPHGNASTEIHLRGGPFTLVPLPDYQGLPSSAVVWMEDGPRAQALHAMPQDAFEAEITTRSTGLLGPLKLASQRTIWPIISQRADRLVDQRLALAAEAAHVVPPIGAQGLNMSLRDLDTLLNLAEAAPERLGDAAMLSAYERARMADIRMRVAGITALNKVSQQGSEIIRQMRANGISALHALPPIRQGLMQLGLGLGRSDRSSGR